MKLIHVWCQTPWMSSYQCKPVTFATTFSLQSAIGALSFIQFVVVTLVGIHVRVAYFPFEHFAKSTVHTSSPSKKLNALSVCFCNTSVVFSVAISIPLTTLQVAAFGRNDPTTGFIDVLKKFVAITLIS